MASNARTFTAFGAVIESLQKRYGGLIVPSFATFAVTNAPQVVAPADPERVFLAMFCIGAFGARVLPLSTTDPTLGILLAANGGSLSFTERDDSIMPVIEWWATVNGGPASTLYVVTARRDVRTGSIENLD